MNPTSQFVVQNLWNLSLFGFDVSITNSSISMIIATIIISALLLFTSRKLTVIPHFAQNIGENFYIFISSMLSHHAGKDGLKYISIVATVFLIILFGNLLGLVPGMYTFTSQLIITASLACLIFFSVIFIGLKEKGLAFFKMFFHSSIPLPIMLFMLPIEIVSFFARPVSLCLRLCINMIAGHMMLKIFAGFAASAPITSILIIPLLIVLTFFELLVAILQAYIFTLLTCIYLKDATGKEHH